MNDSLRNAVSQAIRQMAHEEKITWVTSIRARFALRLASKEKLEKFQQAVYDQAVADGVVQDGTELDGIDWSQFMEFLMKILPIILPLLIALL